eukprot:scaffold64519_cov63-Phaeocystis_antarctica.AAC.2
MSFGLRQSIATLVPLVLSHCDPAFHHSTASATVSGADRRHRASRISDGGMKYRRCQEPCSTATELQRPTPSPTCEWSRLRGRS